MTIAKPRISKPSAIAGAPLRLAGIVVLACLAWGPFGFPASAETPSARPDALLPLTEVTIIGSVGSVGSGSSGGRHSFNAEFAGNARDREKGLMFRPSLPPDGAMLFDFEVTEPVAMWMKNTLIPLDMLFVAGDGKIVNIARDTIPFSLRTIRSDGPVRAVLEVNAGTARRLGIRPGDRLEHGIFIGAGGDAK